MQTLPGEDTRPTAERVKEALFSALQFEIEGRRILDLFAGSGQLGIEALSRGAQGGVFVDRNPEAVEIIRQNLKAAGLTANTQVLWPGRRILSHPARRPLRHRFSGSTLCFRPAGAYAGTGGPFYE